MKNKKFIAIALLIGALLLGIMYHYRSYAQDANQEAAALQKEIKELEGKRAAETGIVNKQNLQKEITEKKQQLQELLEKKVPTVSKDEKVPVIKNKEKQ